MKLVDAIIFVDKDYNILKIREQSEYFKTTYKNMWNCFINNDVESSLGIKTNKKQGIFKWKNEVFIYNIYNEDIDNIFILIKRNCDKSIIYEKALNKLKKGIQIYDKNAVNIFFNDKSKSIESLPADIITEGKHLLDLYNVNEKYSSVLTTLRTKAPVLNRFDTFETVYGKTITSINDAYPLFSEDEIIGSIIIERSINTIKENIKSLNEIKKIMQEKINLELNNSKRVKYKFDNLLGQNKKFIDSIKLAKKVAKQECNVLIYGETGTGKEIFAQSIHEESSRCNNKFVAINCAAIPETLIEGILFGTSKGAFTGSIDKAGLLEEADGGTLFLDELNSMSLVMQSKILRVIQEGSFRRIGADKDIKIDIRIISTCNEDPLLIIDENKLRKDLFYRLSTVIIEIPPLRERRDDIELLLNYFINYNSHKYYKKVSNINNSVINMLKEYSWPGNVRELIHVVEYALNVIDENTMELKHLPKYIFSNIHNADEESFTCNINIFENDLQYIIERYENEILVKILDYYGGNITKTAKSLGIKRQSLQYRMKKYGIIV